MNEEENKIEENNNLNNESSTVDGFYDYTSEEEPVIQKVIDVDKRRKIIIGSIIISLIVIIAIIVFVVLNNNKSKTSIEKRVTSDYSTFVNTINDSISNGDFDKEINKALKEIKINTNELYFVCIDIDSDEDNELVAYVEEGNEKYILIFEIDEEVLYDDSFKVNSKDSLGYAYSFSDDKNYWFTDYVSEYTIIKHPKRVIKVNDFLDNFYTITKTYKGSSIFDNAVLYKSGYKIDVKKMEEDAITEDKVLEDNTTNQDKVKEAATLYKNEKDKEKLDKELEQQRREVESEDQDNIFTLNNKLMNYGTYKEISAASYGNFVIHKNGTCEIGGTTCSWSYGTYDFGLGSAEQSIEVHKENEVIHFTSRGDNTLTNGSNWSATLS